MRASSWVGCGGAGQGGGKGQGVQGTEATGMGTREGSRGCCQEQSARVVRYGSELSESGEDLLATCIGSFSSRKGTVEAHSSLATRSKGLGE